MDKNLNDKIVKLIEKAASAHDSNDALKLSQAALNAANAVGTLTVNGHSLTSPSEGEK